MSMARPLASWPRSLERPGFPFVSYSTDYVFDGTAETPYVESSPTRPINAYGASKELGERLALAANPRTLIIRTSWVISGTHPNFVATMLRFASEGRNTPCGRRPEGCPTITADLARRRSRRWTNQCPGSFT